MNSFVACPHCRQQVGNDGSLSGQVVACPHCRGQFTMPGIAVAPVVSAPAPFVSVKTGSTSARTSPRTKSQPMVPWIVGGAVALFMSCGLLGMVFNSGDKDKYKPDPDEQLPWESTEQWLTRMDDKRKSSKPLADDCTGHEWVKATSKVKIAFVDKAKPKPETFQQVNESIFSESIVREVDAYFENEAKRGERCSTVVLAENSRLFRQAKQGEDARTLNRALQQEAWKRQ